MEKTKKMRKNSETDSLFSYYGFTKRDKKKYPVVSGILKGLTPKKIKKEVEKVQKVKLPIELQKWVREYEKVGVRKKFIWKWLYSVNEILVYSFVQIKHYDSLLIVKTLCSMFIILLDDVCGRKSKDKLLNELLKIPFEKDCIINSQLNNEDKKYLKFTQKVWGFIKKTIRHYPKNNKLEDIFNYDIEQLLNNIKYTHLVKKNTYLINITEYYLYFFYKMQIVINFDLDLMCSVLNFKNLGKDREVILCLQEIARTGNWFTTWEREIKENDFTSAIIAHALDRKIIRMEDCKNKNEIIKKIKNSKIENILLKKEWEKNCKKIYRLLKKSDIKNKGEIFKKAKYLMHVHLIGHGNI